MHADTHHHPLIAHYAHAYAEWSARPEGSPCPDVREGPPPGPTARHRRAERAVLWAGVVLTLGLALLMFVR